MILKWDGRRVFDADSGEYLGRAVGEPWSDGIEGFISLRQDEDGQTIRPYMCCGFVVLDAPPHEEGEPETLTIPDNPELRERIRAIAATHGFPLSDWKPTLPE